MTENTLRKVLRVFWCRTRYLGFFSNYGVRCVCGLSGVSFKTTQDVSCAACVVSVSSRLSGVLLLRSVVSPWSVF